MMPASASCWWLHLDGGEFLRRGVIVAFDATGGRGFHRVCDRFAGDGGSNGLGVTRSRTATAATKRGGDLPLRAHDGAADDDEPDADVLVHRGVDSEHHGLPNEAEHRKQVPEDAQDHRRFARHRVPKQRLADERTDGGRENRQVQRPVVLREAAFELEREADGHRHQQAHQAHPERRREHTDVPGGEDAPRDHDADARQNRADEGQATADPDVVAGLAATKGCRRVNGADRTSEEDKDPGHMHRGDRLAEPHARGEGCEDRIQRPQSEHLGER
mmetsp:Transcript_37133/g.114683  ORF Transcript_37133/g.114683 Transcript_37133/m.114683 type:complete len:274 (-) Transcript_37133:1024-1845(-)